MTRSTIQGDIRSPSAQVQGNRFSSRAGEGLSKSLKNVLKFLPEFDLFSDHQNLAGNAALPHGWTQTLAALEISESCRTANRDDVCNDTNSRAVGNVEMRRIRNTRLWTRPLLRKDGWTMDRDLGVSVVALAGSREGAIMPPWQHRLPARSLLLHPLCKHDTSHQSQSCLFFPAMRACKHPHLCFSSLCYISTLLTV